MMITARALLDRIPDPDEETIRQANSGQICRCTGYTTIVRSIQWAARTPRGNGVKTSTPTCKPKRPLGGEAAEPLLEAGSPS